MITTDQQQEINRLAWQNPLFVKITVGLVLLKKSEYDQEIPQSHNADQPTAREEDSQNIYRNRTSVRQ